MDELRLSWRRLAKRPWSTTASVVALAFAIAATVVTWSALSAVLLHPLPVRDADDVLVVGARTTQGQEAVIRTGLLYTRLQQIQDSGVFERAVAEWNSPFTLPVKVGTLSERAAVGFATHDFFEVLGIRAAVGRRFAGVDDQRGAAPVAVLTHRYWQRAFASSEAVVGETIAVAGRPVTIVGVFQPGFRGLDLTDPVDLYLPFHTIADVAGAGNYFAERMAGYSPMSGTKILGRLRPGSSVAEATARIAALDPPSAPGRSTPAYVLVDLATAAIPEAARSGMARFARLLAVTVALLLLSGCTTVGMLLLIRTEERAGEFAMCLALGASRGRLVRGIALEGAVLAAAGGQLAIPLAWWLFRLIHAFQLPGGVSVDLLELAIDLRVFGATMAAAAAAIALIALVACGLGFRADVADALRARAGATAPTRGRGTRTMLIGAQIAITVVLMAGAALFAHSLIAALRLNATMDMSRLAIGTIQLQPHGYDGHRARAFFDRLSDRLIGLPAVESFAFSTNEGGMSARGRLEIDGLPRQFASTVWYVRVTPQYFSTMGMRVVQGRDFTSDDRRNAPAVAIVSESLARQVGQGGTALGRRIDGFPTPGSPVRVVGVASDVVANVRILEPLMIYLPVAQGVPTPHRDLVVRAAPRAVDAVKRDIAFALKELDPHIAAVPLRTLEERVLAQMGPQRLGATVLGVLGAIAVLLTLLGTSVAADSMATTRMREMGIRAALGATRRQLGGMVLAQTGRLVGFGVAAGLGLAWLGAGTVRAFLFQVGPLDPMTLGAVSALVLVLALAVSGRAALRSARVDLVSVLKAD